MNQRLFHDLYRPPIGESSGALSTGSFVATPGGITLLPEPALAIRIEERVHQIVAVVLGNLERLSLDALVQALRQFRKEEVVTLGRSRDSPKRTITLPLGCRAAGPCRR